MVAGWSARSGRIRSAMREQCGKFPAFATQTHQTPSGNRCRSATVLWKFTYPGDEPSWIQKNAVGNILRNNMNFPDKFRRGTFTPLKSDLELCLRRIFVCSTKIAIAVSVAKVFSGRLRFGRLCRHGFEASD